MIPASPSSLIRRQHAALLNAQIVVQQINVEIGFNQFLFDEIQNGTGHLIAVHFNNRVCDFYLGHVLCLLVRNTLIV